jgi:hypothetical protein
MAIEDALVLSQEIVRLNEDSGDLSGTPRKRLPLALRRYNQNRVVRAAAVQGLSRVSSAFLFQYQPPLDVDWTSFPPKLSHVGPRSLITRACQGFLQNVAFPLQFEFLFSFPGQIDPNSFRSDTGDPEGVAGELFSGTISPKEWFARYM